MYGNDIVRRYCCRAKIFKLCSGRHRCCYFMEIHSHIPNAPSSQWVHIKIHSFMIHGHKYTVKLVMVLVKYFANGQQKDQKYSGMCVDILHLRTVLFI